MACGQFNALESVIRHSSPDCGPCEPEYTVKDYCFVACTDTILPLKLPNTLSGAKISDLWLTITDSDELDMSLVRHGDWSDDPNLFNLNKGEIRIGRCDLCVNGGTYYYEILAKTGEQVMVAQRGRMFIETNYRRKVTECR